MQPMAWRRFANVDVARYSEAGPAGAIGRTALRREIAAYFVALDCDCEIA